MSGVFGQVFARGAGSAAFLRPRPAMPFSQAEKAPGQEVEQGFEQHFEAYPEPPAPIVPAPSPPQGTSSSPELPIAPSVSHASPASVAASSAPPAVTAPSNDGAPAAAPAPLPQTQPAVAKASPVAASSAATAAPVSAVQRRTDNSANAPKGSASPETKPAALPATVPSQRTTVSPVPASDPRPIVERHTAAPPHESGQHRPVQNNVRELRNNPEIEATAQIAAPSPQSLHMLDTPIPETTLRSPVTKPSPAAPLSHSPARPAVTVAATPPRARATQSGKETAPRKVEVTIGRVEVTVPPPPVQEAPRPSSEPAPIGMSLDAFIAEGSQ